MTISKEVWIGLVVSIVVALIIMVATFFITRHKTNKIKYEYIKKVAELAGAENKALERKDHGELLWDLKSKYKDTLDDVLLEFIINTSLRNKYKTFSIENRDEDYEKISLEKIAKMKFAKKTSDINIMFVKDNLNDLFDLKYKELKTKQMIAIVEARRKNKQVKKLIGYLKLSKIKYDYLYMGKGLLLIVK